MLIFFTALYAVVLLATVGIIVLRRPKNSPDAKFTIREIPMTAVLGLFLWLEAGVILYYWYTVPERLVRSRNSQINVCIFLSLSALLGSGLLLYYFVKRVIVSENGVTYVDLFGRSEFMQWEKITSVKQSSGKRMVLEGGGMKFTVGGNRKGVIRFVKYATGKIPPIAGDDVLRNMKKALKIQ